MATYTEYTLKSGVKWAVRGYLGTDEATGEQLEFNKRGFKTKKEAQAAYTRAKNQFYDGEYGKMINKRHITFKQLYHEWLTLYEKTVRSSTFANTKRMFKVHILPELGKIRIDKLSSRELQSAVNTWHKKVRHYKVIFNYACNVLEYAVIHEYIKVNPKHKVVVPKVKRDYVRKKSSDDFYTRSELIQFMDIMSEYKNEKWHTFFRVLAFTGLRRGEALALRWKDVSFKDNTIHVARTLSSDDKNKLVINPPKNGITRTVTLDPTTVNILKAWKTEQAQLLIGFGFNGISPNQLIFSKFKDNGFTALGVPNEVLKRVCEQNNFKAINIHGFRHTHCSLLFEAGVEPKDVKERLGHKDIQTTMNIYTHVTPESRDKSAEMFSKYVNF